MYSHDVELYHKNLIKLTNSSNLTIGCAYYVAKDFLYELHKAYMQDLQRDLLENQQPTSVTTDIDTLVTTPPTEHANVIETHELVATMEQTQMTNNEGEISNYENND